MGVMTVSSQNFMEIDMPGWWLSGSSVDLDLRNGRYYDSSIASPRTISNFLSISRASIGYAKTSGGLLTQFSSGQLRLTDLGLLVEDARTNSIWPSQGFASPADWNNTGSTSANNQTTAPDGTVTAAKLTEDSSAGYHSLSTGTGANPSTTGKTTWSIYVKNAGRGFAGLQAAANGQTVAWGVIVDLSSGAITATHTQSGSPTNTSASTEVLANGWVRIVVTMDTQSTGTAVYLYVSASNTGTPASFGFGGPNYSGDGSSGIYVWGAQVELDKTFPSSYTPTTSTSATRAADNVTISGSAQTVINSAVGSIIAWVNGSPTPIFPANVVDSNGTNLLGYDATDHGVTSITSALATSNTANSTGRDKLGTSWDASGRSLVLNGGTVATDAVAQTPSATQKLGSASATSNFTYAYVDRLALWNTKLSNASLQSFTT